jgi:hypothetical protein
MLGSIPTSACYSKRAFRRPVALNWSVALGHLRRSVAGRSRAETVKHFLVNRTSVVVSGVSMIRSATIISSSSIRLPDVTSRLIPCYLRQRALSVPGPSWVITTLPKPWAVS